MPDRRGAAGTRITAGAYRGRTVPTPPGRVLRPTTALVRQALFDILGDRVAGAQVVDLFAGAGTVGFEALSRGAAHVVAVERDRGLVELMRETAHRLGCADRFDAVPMEVVRWLRARPRDLGGVELCYVDAPYRDDAVATVLELLGETPPAIVVCEHHRARRLPETIGSLRLARHTTYGTTQLSFLRREPPPAAAR